MGATFVTMGDARGIGPEVALMALAARQPLGRVRLVGVPEVWESAARELDLVDLHAGLAADLLAVDPASVRSPPVGAPDRRSLPSAVAGAWAGRSLEAAVSALDPRAGDVLVTAPLDKSALREGGYPFPGHTEMLAALAGVDSVAMMLVARDLRVTLVTGHVPLREAPAAVTRSAIRLAFLHTERALRRGFDVPAPRIGVCGLNPHAGDRGVLGDEEERVVTPAIAGLRDEGFRVEGPLPADTAFVRAVAGEFDAVLALYHDQGMIPVKLHGFGAGVNVTLGLPFVRTSPDHGTALDIAGTGRARPDSFLAALELAHALGGRAGFPVPSS